MSSTSTPTPLRKSTSSEKDKKMMTPPPSKQLMALFRPRSPLKSKDDQETPARTLTKSSTFDTNGSNDEGDADALSGLQLFSELNIHTRCGILGSTSSGSNVHFGVTEILEFPRRPGDNPSVKFGAPLALGEECLSRRCLSVEDFEVEHPAEVRRHKHELVLKAAVRMKLLKESGATPQEIRKAMQAAAGARESRQKQADKFKKEWGARHILTYTVVEKF
jgi:hypothetical protein